MANERWASDDDFPAGTEPWSGEPTKVAPGLVEIAAGHTPGVPVPAETENWWKNRTDARLEDLENRKRLPIFQLHQNWTAPMYAAWTEVTDGTAAVARLVNFMDIMPDVWLKLTTNSNVTPDIAALYSEAITGGPWRDNVIAIMEFRVIAGAILGADVHFQAGLVADGEDVTSTDDFIKIELTNASNNWIFRTGSPGGLTTDTDTGVEVPGTPAAQKFRIVVYGADDPDGARAECWIDDELVATNTTNLPDADPLVFGVNLTSIGELAPMDVWISPMTYVADLID